MTGKLKKRDQAIEAELFLPTSTRRKSGKTILPTGNHAFERWRAFLRRSELYTQTKRHTYEKKEHPHSKKKNTKFKLKQKKSRKKDWPTQNLKEMHGAFKQLTLRSPFKLSVCRSRSCFFHVLSHYSSPLMSQPVRGERRALLL